MTASLSSTATYSTEKAESTVGSAESDKSAFIGVKVKSKRILVPSFVSKNSSAGDCIRKKYYYSLGLPANNHLTTAKFLKMDDSPRPHSTYIRPRLLAYRERLRDHSSDWRTYQDPVHQIKDISDSVTPSVSFNDIVDVRLIPHKDMYSQRIKKNIWTESRELMENAKRNSVEFAAENWDWRQAYESNQFITHPDTGEKVHPAHVHWLDHIRAACYKSSSRQFTKKRLYRQQEDDDLLFNFSR